MRDLHPRPPLCKQGARLQWLGISFSQGVVSDVCNIRASTIGRLRPYLSYADALIVSSDVIPDDASCIFDPSLTQSLGKQVRMVGWHDNEWGYSNRLVDLVKFMGVRL